jgi:hypothetical protein
MFTVDITVDIRGDPQTSPRSDVNGRPSAPATIERRESRSKPPAVAPTLVAERRILLKNREKKRFSEIR